MQTGYHQKAERDRIERTQSSKKKYATLTLPTQHDVSNHQRIESCKFA
ncbi:hypothetical protein [Bartonella raoultii]|nr:hypothetical protein [Bartonella raoultii]